MNNPLKKLNYLKYKVKDTLLKQARKEDNIVFGARAINRKLGINGRRTDDWDFFSKTPKESSNIAQKNLDKTLRKNVFFQKKGVNPSTWKVKHVGRDGKKGTEDDVGIVDFTKTPKPEPKTFRFRKVKYRDLKLELKAKQKLIKDKKFEFRREKDLEDIRRIKKFGGLRK